MIPSVKATVISVIAIGLGIVRPLNCQRLDTRVPKAQVTHGPGLAAVVTAAPSPYVITVTPGLRWDDNSFNVESELRYTRKSGAVFPYIVRITDRGISSDGAWANRLQLDGEVHFLHNDHAVFGFPVFAALLGELQDTQRSGTAEEIAAEVDLTLVGDPEAGPSFAVGILPIYDFSQARDHHSDSGLTMGAEAIWIVSDAVEIDGEYDFNSEFNGEDNTSFKVFWYTPLHHLTPVLIGGLTKHHSYILGFRLAIQ